MTSRSERWFVAVVFVLYAAATLVVALHHEPWRDEADPWLLIRDGGVSTMLARTGFVGMPALWYLALAPVVKLGLPYTAMTLLNLAFAWAAALLFLIAAPFPRVVRALFVFSYFMAFEYAVIARPYALAVLLLFGALAAWRARETRPMPFAICVALLANTTPHMLFVAAMLGLVYARQHRSRLAIAVMLAGGLLAVVQLWPPDAAPQGHLLRGMDLGHLRGAIGSAFFPNLRVRFGSVFAAAVIAVVTLSIGRRVTPQLFLWGSLVPLSAIFAFVWMGGARHGGLILMVVFGALWLALLEGRLRAQSELTVLLGVALAISCIATVRLARADLSRPFSGSAEMGAYLAQERRRLPIAAHPPGVSESVLPYLPGTRFYYPAMQTYGSFMTWDAAYVRAKETPAPAAAALARAHFRDRPFLLLLNRWLEEPRGLRLLYVTAKPFAYREEQYFLYAAERR